MQPALRAAQAVLLSRPELAPLAGLVQPAFIRPAAGHSFRVCARKVVRPQR